MVEPINYSMNVQSPFDALAQGAKFGLGMRQAEVDIASQEAQTAALQEQLRRKQQMEQDIANFASSENRTLADYNKLNTMYPELTAPIKESYSRLNAEQKKNRIGVVSEVLTAANNGRLDISTKKLEDYAVALENSGDAAGAEATRTQVQMMKEHPETAIETLNIALSAIDPKTFAGTLSTLSKDRREQALFEPELTKKQVEAGNIGERTQLENERLRTQSLTDVANTTLGINKAKMESLKLPSDSRKIITDAGDLYAKNTQDLSRTLNLAGEFDKLNASGGAIASTKEWLKRASGNDDEVSNLKKQYTQIRNSEAIKTLPPGSASDGDVKFVLEGFPDANSNPKTLAKFMRGMGKINAASAALASAKSDWVSNFKSLRTADSDTVIDGVQVAKGTSFADFFNSYGDKKANQIYSRADKMNNDNIVRNRGYMNKYGGGNANTQ